jgi:uncharacterized cupredoxin-like copper-binding protein
MHSFRNVASASLLSLAAATGATVVSAGPASASSVTTVKAVETDFHIALSKTSFKAGRYTFVAQNKGQTTHALMITGPGIKMAMTKDISPGQSAKLTVTFKKGAFDIYCPIPGHKAMGMNVNITVGGAATTSSKTTAGSSSSGTAGAAGAAATATDPDGVG